tara:strand:+ start:756 stop:974 length:219 start_codon:yes stop_codon:yes gene_type:complete
LVVELVEGLAYSTVVMLVIEESEVVSMVVLYAVSMVVCVLIGLRPASYPVIAHHQSDPPCMNERRIEQESNG